MKRTIGLHLAIAMALSLGSVSSTWALGILTPNQGARATAQSDAFTAQADDASAIYYNPGGLTQLSGTHALVGSYFWFPEYRFQGATGSEEMDSPAILPHLYITSDFGLERWRFGLGLNNGFGTSVDWGDVGSFRLLVSEAHLSVINLALSFAYQISETLSIGANLNSYHGDAELKRNVFLAPPPVSEGRFRFEGTGQGVGVTLGLLWKPDVRHSVGLVYRSPFDIDLEGSAALSHPVAGMPASSTSVRARLPQILIAGYAFRPVENLKLEANVQWTDWERVNEFRFRSSNPAFNSEIPLNWNSSFSFKFGAQYDLNEHWTVRTGYAFWENTIPASSFSPLVPDSDMHSLSAGIGYSNLRFGFDLAYQYSSWEERTVRGSAFSPFVDGKWETSSHALMVSARWKF